MLKINGKTAIVVALLLSFFTSGVSINANAQSWVAGAGAGEYNPGPDPKTPMGRAFIDLFAELPEYMQLSNELMDKQKFRYIFGLMLTRTYFEKDAVKVFFIGQDATHIAEAAKQPGTSGFGARVQSIGNYLGVDKGVSTSNAFLSTIKGQYGAFEHVYVETNKDGQPEIRQSKYVDNELWMIANGDESSIRKSREKFWELMIKNNPESLSLMVLFGDAAKDSFAQFLISRGAKVPTRLNPDRLKAIQVPETVLVNAGGNNEFPVPIDRNGKDIYEILLGRKVNYADLSEQKAAVAALKAAGRRGIDMMVFTGGGLHGSGVVDAAQLGGFDLTKVEINGVQTNSLEGLKLSDGTVIKRALGFVVSAHPTVLSKMEESAASESLRKSFEPLEKIKGFKIVPDEGFVNRWAEGLPYAYGRADIRPGYFEFGAPEGRRVSRADASRLDPQTIIAGSRQKIKVDQRELSQAKEAKPSDAKDPNDLWSVRPRQPKTRGVFDRGPGVEFAKAWMSSFDRNAILAPKAGKQVIDAKGRDVTFETHGIDGYNAKTLDLFGFHRGSFTDSRVLILADPQGVDDWNSARALTGARGQYLNGLMRDLGVGENYLVIKTAPVGMDGASSEEWEEVRRVTEGYREVAIKEALKNKNLELIMTDGPIAKAEMDRILSKFGASHIEVVSITRETGNHSSGIEAAGKEVQRLGNFGKTKISAAMADIPRSHLSWWSRSWEGTGGDTTINALGKDRGKVFAVVTPNWVVKQKVRPLPATVDSIGSIRATLENLGIRVGKEPLGEFLSRRGIKPGLVPKVFGAENLKPAIVPPLRANVRPLTTPSGVAEKIRGGAKTCRAIFP